MTDPEDRHPSTLSDEERAELRASDPAAFDDDDAPGDEAGGEEDDEAGDAAQAAARGEDASATSQPTKEADPDAVKDTGKTEQAKQGDGKGGEAAAGAEGATPVAEGESGKEDMPDLIPKARFNEVLGRAKDLERENQALREKQTAAAHPARDFKAEAQALNTKYVDDIKALAKRYDEDGDLTTLEYEEERAKLLAAYQDQSADLSEARSAHAALSAVEKQRAEEARKAAEQSWESARDAWQEKHADFMANSIRKQAVASLLDTYGQDASLSNDELLAKVEAEAFEAFNWQDAPKTKQDGVDDKHAGRRIADAAAAANASATPPPLSAGVGARGGPSKDIDAAKLKPGEFSKLPKSEQEKMLGEGALD